MVVTYPPNAIADSAVALRTDESDRSLHYTPVMTQSPTEFASAGYKCRFAQGECSVFVVITMYNEGPDELKRSLLGVCRNLQAFTVREDDQSFWKRIVVCIVSDGRSCASNETLEWATEQGIFSQDNVKHQLEKDSSVGMHLFEVTTNLNDNDGVRSEYPPIQLMYALKENNSGKIDSHYWFFEAFAAQINPEYCFLIDVGTKPMPKALYFLWQTMRRNDQIAGCAGEICTMSTFSLNPLIAAQTFEYKVSNYLDKATESMFGYVSVLPGAFSAYRYQALVGAPLQKYFHHISTPMAQLTPFEANQYLAEDRILCFELLAKAGHQYTLHYDRRARAETDAPDDLIDLIKQRRRWLNGSLLATLYTVINLRRFLTQTTHTPIRKLAISFQFLIFIVQLTISWLLVANVYLIFYFSLIVILGSGNLYFMSLRYLFIALIVIQFVLGLGNKPGSVSTIYALCTVVWSALFCCTAVLSMNALFSSKLDASYLILAFGASIGALVVSGILHGQIVYILANCVQFFLTAPVFLVIFPVYSICNLHDISWGTKGLTEAAEIVRHDITAEQSLANVNEQVRAKLRRVAKLRAQEKVERAVQHERFSRFRSYVLLVWMLSQMLYVSLLTTISDKLPNRALGQLYLKIMFMVVAGWNAVRFIGSVSYLIVHQKNKSKSVPAYPAIAKQEFV